MFRTTMNLAKHTMPHASIRPSLKILFNRSALATALHILPDRIEKIQIDFSGKYFIDFNNFLGIKDTLRDKIDDMNIDARLIQNQLCVYQKDISDFVAFIKEENELYDMPEKSLSSIEQAQLIIDANPFF